MLVRGLCALVALLFLAACDASEAASPSEISPGIPPTAEQTAIPVATPSLVAGTTRIDASGVAQVWVPAGCFLMGTDPATVTETPPAWARGALVSEQPQHEVCLSQGYWIDQHEVSNADYQKFIDAGGYDQEQYWSLNGWRWRKTMRNIPVECPDQQPNYPRVCITWYEADAYSRWRGGRLPTEAEWEYAARGPESLIYPWGNSFDSARANVLDSTGLVAIGSYPTGVSWVGAHDMSGNAMEWVQDWFDIGYYADQVRIDPLGPTDGIRKVEKGGWWGSNPFVARAAYRHFEDLPSYQDHHIGVRVVTPE